MKIIEYINAQNIKVEFQDEYKGIATSDIRHFKNGKIKNPYKVTIFNIGKIGQTTIYKDKKLKESYKHWTTMLKRCYDEKSIMKNPAYKNVTVCDDWLIFENFEKWFEDNYYEIDEEIMELDKDILIKGNKIYSPEACVFTPRKINSLFKKSKKRNIPEGIFKDKNNKFIAYCSNKDGDRIYLGYYNTFEDAFKKRKEFKEKVIKQIADEYKDKIPEKLYNTMVNYRIEITN